ncbi:hypothetical protein [Maritalea sp. S77]|uniref:hypothetical protein n=1 Tax=Maritalea sp. S77 TaxID=3415125 RepID=UPI003C7D396C
MYSLQHAAFAAEIDKSTLSRWLDTGIIKMRGPDVDSGSSGIPRQFSRQRIVQIAIAKALANIGVSPGRGAAAALKFTEEENCEIPDTGCAWLVMDDAGPRLARVDHEPKLAEVLLSPGGWAPIAAVAIDLSRIVRRVDARLQQKQSNNSSYGNPIIQRGYETK